MDKYYAGKKIEIRSGVGGPTCVVGHWNSSSTKGLAHFMMLK